MSTITGFRLTSAIITFTCSLLSAIGSGLILLCYLALPLKKHFRHVLILNLAVAGTLTFPVCQIYMGVQMLILDHRFYQLGEQFGVGGADPDASQRSRAGARMCAQWFCRTVDRTSESSTFLLHHKDPERCVPLGDRHGYIRDRGSHSHHHHINILLFTPDFRRMGLAADPRRDAIYMVPSCDHKLFGAGGGVVCTRVG